MKNKKVKVLNLGLKPFDEVWQLQKDLLNSIVEEKLANREREQKLATKNYLLVVQHQHVYTLGKSGKENHLLVNEQFLKQIGASFVPIERGGDITYHGPGQIVLYPIFDMENFFTDIHRYMRSLEEVIIQVCKDFYIEAGRSRGETGVWIEAQIPRKICAMGVKMSRWVSMHGLALNVNTDLSYFNHIVPCGISDKDVTSIQREWALTGKNGKPDEQKVTEAMLKHFSKVFECEFE